MGSELSYNIEKNLVLYLVANEIAVTCKILCFLPTKAFVVKLKINATHLQ